MVRALNFVCVALMGLAILGLYHVSEKTRVARMELNQTHRQIAAEKGAIAGDKFERVNHYCLVDVKGSDVTVKAIRTDGTLIEKFTVSAK